MSGQSGWDLLRRAEAEAARTAFENHPDFSVVVADAAARGFRRITLAEQLDGGKADAYSWRGGIWVRQ
jgi:hypothetical protein